MQIEEKFPCREGHKHRWASNVREESFREIKPDSKLITVYYCLFCKWAVISPFGYQDENYYED